MFGLFWEQFKEFLESAVPFAAQAALFYLIVRFALAVAGLLLDLAASTVPQPQPANGPQPPQVAGRPARPGIPERASS
ncbi:MAG: hypothetical protein A3J27_05500 [Candidatus Tectomicrobia bacterium RIFCSPLOWO2_12_FULL_69_37]|nr:MAG: hypothetical protein A3J27_05500 [Candidatus Tectomicrobia bacterium RIFCSPLOWO2_12_FULL_69_37]